MIPNPLAPLVTGKYPATKSSRLTLTLFFAGAIWLIATGVAIASSPWVGALFGLAPLLTLLLFRYGWVRLTIVVVGGLFVLGSSSDLGPNKLLYAGVVIICAVISAWRLFRDPPGFIAPFRPLIWWGLGIVGVLLISLFGSPAGSDFATFGRQSIFYFLVILGPIIGLDAGREISPSYVYGLIAFIGVLSAVGFALDWLNRRGVTALSIDRLTLSSLLLPAFSFALALVMVVHSRTFLLRALWFVPIVAIPVAMLVTGNRTNVVIALAIFAVLGALQNCRVPFARMTLIVAAAAALGIAVFPVVAGALVSDPTFLARRLALALTVVGGNAESDASFAGRSDQYAIASELIGQSPYFGWGAGFTPSRTIDSPLMTIVRFGWIGTVMFAGFLAALCVAVYRSRRQVGPSPAHTAWWGFILVLLAYTPLAIPLEDRGFGFTLMLASMALASALSHGAVGARPHLSGSSHSSKRISSPTTRPMIRASQSFR